MARFEKVQKLEDGTEYTVVIDIDLDRLFSHLGRPALFNKNGKAILQAGTITATTTKDAEAKRKVIEWKEWKKQRIAVHNAALAGHARANHGRTTGGSWGAAGEAVQEWEKTNPNPLPGKRDAL